VRAVDGVVLLPARGTVRVVVSGQGTGTSILWSIPVFSLLRGWQLISKKIWKRQKKMENADHAILLAGTGEESFAALRSRALLSPLASFPDVGDRDCAGVRLALK